VNKTTSRPSDAQLDRLLGNRPSFGVTERESVLARVLEASAEPSYRRAPAWWWLLRAGATAAAAVALVFALSPRRAEDEFAARGAALRPSFSLSCLVDGQPGPCRRGSKLVFELRPERFESFAAVAEGPDGTTLWLFPSGAENASADVTHLGSRGVLEEAVTLDVAGEYVVYGLFSHERLDRDSIRRALSYGGVDGAIAVQRVSAP
jgi:hypothetical protein